MSDTLPEWSYPDWPYLKVIACLSGYTGRHKGYWYHQSRESQDFLAVWDDSELVTLFYTATDAINLPAQLAHAVRHDGEQSD